MAGVDIAAEAAAAGVDADLLRRAAEAFGQAAAATIIYGTGAVQGSAGATTVAALADLALLTGNVGRAGAGVVPLRSGANSQGLFDMGAVLIASQVGWRTMQAQILPVWKQPGVCRWANWRRVRS